MKKNKLMRLASCLLVGTLLTTCAISGTFAKYTTQDAAKDSARVAKWGVELQIIGSLYGDAYVNGAEGVSIPTIYASDNTVSVYNKAEDMNVVAPGTKSDSPFSFKLNGTPEVDTQILATIKTENIFLAAGTYGIMVKVDIPVTAENFPKLGDLYTIATADDVNTYTKADTYTAGIPYYTLEDVVTAADIYYPVVYNYNSANDADDTTYGEDTTNVNTLDVIASSIADKLNGTGTKTKVDLGADYADDSNLGTTAYRVVSQVYDTNTDLTTKLNLGAESINWYWHFTDYVGTDGDEVNAGIDDKYETNITDPHDGLDTILGNINAADENVDVVKLSSGSYVNSLIEGTDYNLETSFSLDITVNQVD